MTIPRRSPGSRIRLIAVRVLLPSRGGVHEDQQLTVIARSYVTSSVVASSTFQLSDGVGLHAIAETDYDAVHDLQLRVIGVLDFAFYPEP